MGGSACLGRLSCLQAVGLNRGWLPRPVLGSGIGMMGMSGSIMVPFDRHSFSLWLQILFNARHPPWEPGSGTGWVANYTHPSNGGNCKALFSFREPFYRYLVTGAVFPP